MSELEKINKTLEKIEAKIEDKNKREGGLFGFANIFDWTKTQEEARKGREEKRNDELLKIQKAQSENFKIQTESIKNQENFNKIIAFTGAIIALTTIYAFIVQSINLENYPQTYWPITIIFLTLILICLGPLVSFIINFWKKEVFGK